MLCVRCKWVGRLLYLTYTINTLEPSIHYIKTIASSSLSKLCWLTHTKASIITAKFTRVRSRSFAFVNLFYCFHSRTSCWKFQAQMRFLCKCNYVLSRLILVRWNMYNSNCSITNVIKFDFAKNIAQFIESVYCTLCNTVISNL